MQIKTFNGMSSVDKKVNEFLARDDIEVIDVQYQSVFYVSVMVVYREKVPAAE